LPLFWLDDNLRIGIGLSVPIWLEVVQREFLIEVDPQMSVFVSALPAPQNLVLVVLPEAMSLHLEHQEAPSKVELLVLALYKKHTVTNSLDWQLIEMCIVSLAPLEPSALVVAETLIVAEIAVVAPQIAVAEDRIVVALELAAVVAKVKLVQAGLLVSDPN